MCQSIWLILAESSGKLCHRSCGDLWSQLMLGICLLRQSQMAPLSLTVVLLWLSFQCRWLKFEWCLKLEHLQEFLSRPYYVSNTCALVYLFYIDPCTWCSAGVCSCSKSNLMTINKSPSSTDKWVVHHYFYCPDVCAYIQLRNPPSWPQLLLALYMEVYVLIIPLSKRMTFQPANMYLSQCQAPLNGGGSYSPS